MADNHFFLRSRGKVTGPFDVPTLQKLAKRGMLTAMDELSEDRKAWSRAGDYEDLFPLRRPTTVARSAPSNAAVAEPEVVQAEPVMETAPAVSESPAYFYQQPGGVTVGPVPMGILRSLADNGTLRPEDLVWQDGAQTTTPAGQFAQLAPIFFGRGRARGVSHENLNDASLSYGSSSAHQMKIPSAPADVLKLRKSNSGVETYVISSAIIVSILTLLAVHLPWAAVNGKAIGWWSVLQNTTPATDSSAGMLILAVIILTLSALAVAITGSVLRGYSRAYTLLGIGAIGVLNYILGIFTTPSASLLLLGFTVLYLIPAAATSVGALCRTYACVQGSEKGKTLLGVSAGVLGLSSIVMAIVFIPWLIQASKFASVLVGLILFVLALLAFMATSVLGFICLKPQYSPALCLSARICARTGIGLLLASCLLAVFDFSGWASFGASLFAEFGNVPQHSLAADVRIMVILTLLRVGVIVFFYPMCLAMAIEELANALVVSPVLAKVRKN